MKILSSVNTLLSHIREVETNVIELSRESMLILCKAIEKNGIKLDEESVKALQYQDIISQQLNATIEAIESVQKSINIFESAHQSDEQIMNDSLSKLQTKLNGAIVTAKDRAEAFSGNVHKDDEDSIEFF